MDRTCLCLCTTLSLGELHACDYCSRRTRHVFHATIYDLLSVCASLDLLQRLQVALNRPYGNDVSSLLETASKLVMLYTHDTLLSEMVCESSRYFPM